MDKHTLFTTIGLVVVVGLLTFVYFSSLEQVKVCQEANDKIDAQGCVGYCSMLFNLTNKDYSGINFSVPFDSIVETNNSQSSP